jgi:hypothetical protein
MVVVYYPQNYIYVVLGILTVCKQKIKKEELCRLTIIMVCHIGLLQIRICKTYLGYFGFDWLSGSE